MDCSSGCCGRDRQNADVENHKRDANNRRLTESVERLAQMKCLIIRNVDKPKIVFIGLHDCNKTSRQMEPVAYEFFEQYSDVHAAWVMPDAPFHQGPNVRDSLSWWPSPPTADHKLTSQRRRGRGRGVIKGLCCQEPQISSVRSSITALFKAVEHKYEVASDWICLIADGQGTIVALDALFHMPCIPRALGLWNPLPALYERWRNQLCTFDKDWRSQILRVPIFLQDNSTDAFRGLSAQLVDCFLSYEGFKMTSFNDDHLGPQITPTDAGNFFRFVNPPRG